jgi:transcriptional regulator with XRE-family HTH domain
MNRPAGTDEDENAPGRRLEHYIKARWTRRNGGILKLAGNIGASTETVYAWFRGESEPSMAHLRLLADQLGVRRAVLVAVLDGDPLPGEAEHATGASAGAINALSDVLRPLVDQSTEGIEARLRAVEAELLHRDPRGAEASQGRSAPRGKAE